MDEEKLGEAPYHRGRRRPRRCCFFREQVEEWTHGGNVRSANHEEGGQPSAEQRDVIAPDVNLPADHRRLRTVTGEVRSQPALDVAVELDKARAPARRVRERVLSAVRQQDQVTALHGDGSAIGDL
jgi:hypothetical protein